jgi:hypothetical protein
LRLKTSQLNEFVYQASVRSCSGISSQRRRFGPVSGLGRSVCRRPVVVVDEQGYRQPEVKKKWKSLLEKRFCPDCVNFKVFCYLQ